MKVTQTIAPLVFCIVVIFFALTQPVNPWPVDGWYETHFKLFTKDIGGDNYTPISAPAISYKFSHFIAAVLGADIKGEFYIAALTQNLMLLIATFYVFASLKLFVKPWIAFLITSLYLAFILSTGVRFYKLVE
jgi:hypothetical protein